MTNDKALDGVLRYVMAKYVQLTVQTQVVRTRRTASVHIDQAEGARLLAFIQRKTSCSAQDAQYNFRQAAREATESTAWGRNRAVEVRLAVTFVLLLVPLIVMAMLVEDSRAAYAPYLVIVPLLAVMWAWQPRRQAMDKAWYHTADRDQCLDALYEIQQMPIRQLVWERQRLPLVGCAVCLALLAAAVGVVASAMAAHAAETAAQEQAKTAFRQEMDALLGSPEAAGTKYVAYVVADGEYTDAYIPDKYRAETAADVRAVLRITSGAEQVGQYSDGGGAYKRCVTVDVVDMRTGRTVLSETVYGGEPPLSVQTGQGVQSAGYGSVPTQKKIEEACTRLIVAFENMAR